MAKKTNKKLTKDQEKEVDYFVERLANILITQVEFEAEKKQNIKKRSETKSK